MKTIVYFLGLMLITTACNSQTAESETYQRVNNTEWAKALSEADDTPQIIDVRTPEEFAEGTIEGSVNIDFLADGFLEKMNEQLDKEETIYIYCRSGGRSAKAATLLIEAGYSNIIELETGYSGYDKK
jgi:rhodanese-related sulfurtransferase